MECKAYWFFFANQDQPNHWNVVHIYSKIFVTGVKSNKIEKKYILYINFLYLRLGLNI